jgi:hypothetical protein
MRRLIALMIAALTWHAPATAAPSRTLELSSREAVLAWIWTYRAKRDLGRVPAAVQATSRLGALRDPENSGVYIGFMAGVIGSNPTKAAELIGKMLPLPPEDQWALVRAIAYSGHPDWKALLQQFAERLPARKVMVDRYLDGKLPTLDRLMIEQEPDWGEKAWSYIRVDKYFTAKPKEVVLEPSPDVLDTLWGYYFATGAYSPLARILSTLPWSKERDNVERLTLGNMARYTLATNAARDGDTLAVLKWAQPQQPKEVAPILAEVIEAAETVDTARLRKEALAAIEELKRKGPGSRRDMTWWGKIGEGALALGCIGAAVAGQVELGIPCVVGGAISSAALRYWGSE